MRVLFTGFEPFGDAPYNPSWDCAQAAAEATDGEARLLPVTFDVARSIGELAPDYDLLVHFGVATKRSDVCLERYAHNWWAEPDTPLSRIVAGPVALECPLPLDRLAAELDGTADLRWRVSHDAGTYVCNATLFHALSVSPHAMFVHVPAVEVAVAREIGAAIAARIGVLSDK